MAATRLAPAATLPRFSFPRLREPVLPRVLPLALDIPRAGRVPTWLARASSNLTSAQPVAVEGFAIHSPLPSPLRSRVVAPGVARLSLRLCSRPVGAPIPTSSLAWLVARAWLCFVCLDAVILLLGAMLYSRSMLHPYPSDSWILPILMMATSVTALSSRRQ